jgi:hypothetical protein
MKVQYWKKQYGRGCAMKRERGSSETGKIATIAAVVTIVTGIAGLLLAAFPELRLWNKARNAPSVQIVSPVDGQQVPRALSVKVNTARVPATSNVWVLVKAPDPGRYYPQGRVTREGEFEILANIGTRGASTTKEYQIIAVVADAEATEVFKRYCDDRRAYPAGIPLPRNRKGIEEKAAVGVTRANALDDSGHRDLTCSG